MRKIFILLNINLILFLFNVFLSFYIIFIRSSFGFIRFDLEFFKYFQLTDGDVLPVLNSINATIFLSVFSFILNLIISLVLIFLYFKGGYSKFFNLLKMKNKILFEFGVWVINPYVIENRMIAGRSRSFRVLQLLFYGWLVLFPILFIFHFEVIHMPIIERVFYLIVNDKIYLFLFNFLLFFLILFMWFGFLFVWILIFFSMFKK